MGGDGNFDLVNCFLLLKVVCFNKNISGINDRRTSFTKFTIVHHASVFLGNHHPMPGHLVLWVSPSS